MLSNSERIISIDDAFHPLSSSNSMNGEPRNQIQVRVRVSKVQRSKTSCSWPKVPARGIGRERFLSWRRAESSMSFCVALTFSNSSRRRLCGSVVSLRFRMTARKGDR